MLAPARTSAEPAAPLRSWPDAEIAFGGEVSWCPPNLMHESLRLDVGGPDHLGPFLGFLRDKFAELGGRARQRRTTHLAKARLELGIGERGIDLLVELPNDLSGRARRHADAVPVACLVIC